MHVCVAVGLVEVVAAHHRVHDHACCHLQADCLESGISSGPLRSTMSMGTFTVLFFTQERDDSRRSEMHTHGRV